MTWSRFDDGYDEHEKIDEAWHAFPPNPVGLHVMATTACNRWLSDGVIRPRWIAEKLPKRRDRDQILSEMVAVELLDMLPAGEIRTLIDTANPPNEITVGPFPEDRYLVHDFLDRHDSSVQVKDKRRRDADRKARNRHSSAGSPQDVRADSTRTPSGIQSESAGSPRVPRARPRGGPPAHPSPALTDLRPSDAVAASGDAPPADRIWTAYLETRHRVLGARSNPRLTADRRALIARRLKDWPLPDLLDAVQGWQHFPHNRGENQAGTPYCDLELILRDTAHIERFRDKHRESGQSGESMADLADRMTAAHQAAA